MSTSDTFYLERIENAIQALAILQGYAQERADAAHNVDEYSGPCALADAITKTLKAATDERAAVVAKYSPMSHAANEKAVTQLITLVKRGKEVAA